MALMPPVRQVKAFCAALAHPMETEDTAADVVQFEGGALGAIYATTASYPGNGKRLEFHGTKGTYVWDDAKTCPSRPDRLDYADHLACFEAFVDSLDGVAPYPIRSEEVLATIDLINRIYEDSGEVCACVPRFF